MEYNINDKVIPIGSTIYGIKLEDSIVWKEAKSTNQPYLIITDYYSDDNGYCCSINKDYLDNSWYENNIKPYKDSRKLIKELFT